MLHVRQSLHGCTSFQARETSAATDPTVRRITSSGAAPAPIGLIRTSSAPISDRHVGPAVQAASDLVVLALEVDWLTGAEIPDDLQVFPEVLEGGGAADAQRRHDSVVAWPDAEPEPPGGQLVDDVGFGGRNDRVARVGLHHGSPQAQPRGVRGDGREEGTQSSGPPLVSQAVP